MLETKTELITVQRESANVEPIGTKTQPVLAPVKLHTLLSDADKIDIRARHLMALHVYDTSGSVKSVSLGATVDPRTQFVRDASSRLSGMPVVTGG